MRLSVLHAAVIGLHCPHGNRLGKRRRRPEQIDATVKDAIDRARKPSCRRARASCTVRIAATTFPEARRSRCRACGSAWRARKSRTRLRHRSAATTAAAARQSAALAPGGVPIIPAARFQSWGIPEDQAFRSARAVVVTSLAQARSWRRAFRVRPLSSRARRFRTVASSPRSSRWPAATCSPTSDHQCARRHGDLRGDFP